MTAVLEDSHLRGGSLASMPAPRWAVISRLADGVVAGGAAAIVLGTGASWVAVAAPLLWLLARETPGAARLRVRDSSYRGLLTAWFGTLTLTTFVAAVATHLLDPVSAHEVLLVIVPATAAAALLASLTLLVVRRLAVSGRTRVVVVGPASDARDFIARHRSGTVEVVGACVPDGLLGDPTGHEGIQVATRDRLRDLVRATRAQSVVVVTPGASADEVRALQWALEPVDVPVSVPLLWDVAPHRVFLRLAGPEVLAEVAHPRLHRTPLVRAVLDRALAALALVLLAPLLLAIAVAIKLDSPGPVLFRHERTGLAGRRFPVLKFRTMVADAEAQKAALLAQNQYQSGTLFKMADDPRITRVGRVLRKTSLDELPQLVNIVRGDMALVGPRPTSARPEDMPGAYARRTLVKPGLTGLWQVSGRSDLPFEEAVRLDLHYVENQSHLLDAAILARTVKTVLHRDGAY